MNKNSLNNKKKRLIIIMIILIILVLGLLLVLLNLFKKEEDPANIRQSTHYPEKLMEYSNLVTDIYEGEYDINKISTRINILFETFLPMISEDVKDKSEEEIRAYFQDDMERLTYNTGISDEDEFLEFAKKLQALDCDLTEFESITFLESSFTTIDGVESFLFRVKYENGNQIDCKIYIQEIDEELNMKFEIQ